jgi:acetolactate synthase-1/2/3 large subunit
MERTGQRYLAEMVHGYGLTHVFFVPTILTPALAAMGEFGITRVTTHSEKAAAYMADGYARAARRPGLCMAQTVGAANLAAGLKDAWLAARRVIASLAALHLGVDTATSTRSCATTSRSSVRSPSSARASKRSIASPTCCAGVPRRDQRCARPVHPELAPVNRASPPTTPPPPRPSSRALRARARVPPAADPADVRAAVDALRNAEHGRLRRGRRRHDLGAQAEMVALAEGPASRSSRA